LDSLFTKEHDTNNKKMTVIMKNLLYIIIDLLVYNPKITSGLLPDVFNSAISSCLILVCHA